MKIKAIVEKQDQGYIAYLSRNNDSLVGADDTAEQALEDLKKAIRFKMDTEQIDFDTAVQEIFVEVIEIDLEV